MHHYMTIKQRFSIGPYVGKLQPSIDFDPSRK